MADLVPDRSGGARDPIAPQPPTVLVVDADDRTRESMVGILGIRHRFRVVGSAGYIAEALSLVETHHPDVVIVDPRLPEVSGGVALIRRIRAMDPRVRILAVGWSPDLEHDMFAAGADGFERKTYRPDDLAAAVDRCRCEPAVGPGAGPGVV
jgi:DNA-binding NarL/FixJ family response regulator